MLTLYIVVLVVYLSKTISKPLGFFGWENPSLIIYYLVFSFLVMVCVCFSMMIYNFKTPQESRYPARILLSFVLIKPVIPQGFLHAV